MYIHCMYYRKDLAALHNGSAHQLRRDDPPAYRWGFIDEYCQLHNTMTFLLNIRAASCMGLLGAPRELYH